MIQSSVDEWIAAANLYHKEWEIDDAPERALSDLIRNEDNDALWRAAGRFRVARQFDTDQDYRDAIAALTFQFPRPNTSVAFKNNVIALASQIKSVSEARKLKRRPFPLSASSKFLMLRYPQKGFVFDQNARQALWGLACTRGYPYAGPEDTRLLELEAFFARWTGLIEPLISLFSKKVFDSPHARRKASRCVDKFLWLRGSSDPGEEFRAYRENASDWAIKYGTSAFKKGCKAGLIVEHPQ